jgi:aspartokinase/homoserine dehydrogenase 1
MKELNLTNTIFIDNTASAEITRFYEDLLDASISISTPNKIATSASFLQYQRLKTLAAKRGVLFLYETNVGAGLPVITTLNDLIHSGDEIHKIEAILSGTLSYIFNNFAVGTAFSDIVRKAMDLGYTEPDPRIDLSGTDVARKLIILAREAGYQLEHSDVTIQNILPKACVDAGSVTDFLYQLEAHNSHFANMAADAEKQGTKLRFIATLENGKASIQLKGVTPDDPFYHLSGSDNMIVFTTQRYQERPLVIRGPGAGAEVTAAGVFAEIIRIGNYL